MWITPSVEIALLAYYHYIQRCSNRPKFYKKKKNIVRFKSWSFRTLKPQRTSKYLISQACRKFSLQKFLIIYERGRLIFLLSIAIQSCQYFYDPQIKQFLMHIKKYQIECYVPPWYGHSIPMAKVAEILTKNMPNVHVQLIAFQLHRQILSAQFKNVDIEFLYPEHNLAAQEKLDYSKFFDIFQYVFSRFEDYLQQKTDLPDLIIADMCTVAPMKFAKKHGIPLIINFPNSYSCSHEMFNFASLKRSFIIDGFLIICPMPKHEFLHMFDNVFHATRGHGRFIFPSFAGLDDPCILPANHTLVGLMPSRSSAELTSELKEWIEGWKSKGKDKFLYVSFGSILKLSLNFARKLANTFIQLGYPTIWSLRAKDAEHVQDPLIFHRPWLPQEAVLRLPQVRGCLTHCGWGSITEAITTTTPLICVPGFADQPQNAKIVYERKIGVIIYQTVCFKVLEEHQIDISEEQIKEGVKEIMENDSYLKSIERMNRMSSLHDSTENICRVVTQALEFGHAHLIHPLSQDSTIRTGYPLSKIIKEQYLPQEKA